jgi:hypothetical protein
MYRQRMHDLIQLVESGKKPRLYLDGPRGEVLTSMCISLASSHTADSHGLATVLWDFTAGCICWLHQQCLRTGLHCLECRRRQEHHDGDASRVGPHIRAGRGVCTFCIHIHGRRHVPQVMNVLTSSLCTWHIVASSCLLQGAHSRLLHCSGPLHGAARQ